VKLVGVAVVSDPPDAKIMVGGKVVGKTPMTLDAKPGTSLEVVISKSGHRPERRTLAVTEAGGAIDVTLRRAKKTDETIFVKP